MRKAGIITIVATLVGAGLLLVIWLVSLVAGFSGGGLIHLLLILALLVAPVGTAVGVALLLIGKRQSRQQ